MPRDESYIQIQGWMVSELGLKGNELIVYALIYGFSQDGESEFKGSLTYIAEWLNTSRPTAIKALSALVDRGLVNKSVSVINGVTFCAYKTLYPVKKLYQGSKETLLGGSKVSLPNNTKNNNTKNNTRYICPTVDEVKAYCDERGNNIDPQYFVDYYSARNWELSKGRKVKDWKATVRTWEKNGKRWSNDEKQKASNRFVNYEQRGTDYDAVLDQINGY